METVHDRAKPDIMVALSGGGHRATLFGLGVLLALVDLGLNRRVVQIASVSGGSITNAYVALRSRFENETPESFDRVVNDLVSIVVNRGVLTTPWLAALAAAAVAPPIILALTCFAGCTPPLKVTLPILTVWLTLLLLRGLIVEKLLSFRYLRHNGRSARFEDLQANGVEHVICSTDLAHGKPCYFSSWEKGTIYVRTHDYFGLGRLIPKLPLEVAVRASAGFPGIPPKRLPLENFKGKPKKSFTFGGRLRSPKPERVARAPTVYLADGGVWNNLATQALLEDEYFRGEDNSLHVPSIALVANGSAALDAVSSWPFCIPGWAEIRALLRIATVQNANTVTPRAQALKRALFDSVIDDRAPNIRRLWSIVVDISQSPQQAMREWSLPFSHAYAFPLRSPEQRRWRGKLASDLCKWWWGHLKAKSPGPDLNALYELVRDAVENRPPSRKVEGLDRLSHLKGHAAFSTLCELCAGEPEKVPTTLGRIPKTVASTLLARGYANTLVAAFAFELIGWDELEAATLTKERLEALIS